MNVPKNYESVLTIKDTLVAIKKLKQKFESVLSCNLNLTCVSGPLFVKKSCRINDTLDGVEKPVLFDSHGIDSPLEIVTSLAKWKRMAVSKYNFQLGEGLYVDMNAIRKGEQLDNLHSIRVDQYDWEKVIGCEQRTIEFLKQEVKIIYESILLTEEFIAGEYPELGAGGSLAKNIYFITNQKLQELYPLLFPKEREDAICKIYGSVCVMQIGVSDCRSPEYDSWTKNCDILVYSNLLNCAIELSSMGIRVDAHELKTQLRIYGFEGTASSDYHRLILDGKSLCTIGGGIGQSRLAMLLLKKCHIGEVQASIWDDETVHLCEKNNIHLL